MMGLALIMELLAVVALLWIVAWQPEVRGRQILRLVIVLWGTTAFGVVHVYIEHVIMIGFRFSTWNPPPGFGYLIFATITISAILTVIMTLRTPRRDADDEPGHDKIQVAHPHLSTHDKADRGIGAILVVQHALGVEVQRHDDDCQPSMYDLRVGPTAEPWPAAGSKSQWLPMRRGWRPRPCSRVRPSERQA